MSRRACVGAALAVVLMVTGCSSSSKSSKSSHPTTTSVSASTTTTSGAAPTIAPPGIPSTVASADCGGEAALLAAIRGSVGNGTLHLAISEFVESKTDPSWVRAKLPPPNPPDPQGALSDGAVVVAHCEAGHWQGVDVGTRGVGCNPPVPPEIIKEIGFACP